MGVRFSRRIRSKKKRSKVVIVPISLKSNILNDLNELELQLSELRHNIKDMKIHLDEKNNYIEES
jgi:hypothetical protein